MGRDDLPQVVALVHYRFVRVFQLKAKERIGDGRPRVPVVVVVTLHHPEDGRRFGAILFGGIDQLPERPTRHAHVSIPPKHIGRCRVHVQSNLNGGVAGSDLTSGGGTQNAKHSLPHVGALLRHAVGEPFIHHPLARVDVGDEDGGLFLVRRLLSLDCFQPGIGPGEREDLVPKRAGRDDVVLAPSMPSARGGEYGALFI